MEMVHFIPPSQRRFALMAAQADSTPVLIQGAAGTGKGAIAYWIHLNGPRSAFAYIEAQQGKPLASQILEAQGGTLTIPEIGEWPLAEQKILLGFLKTKAVPTIQSLPQLANVRIIVTTSQALGGRAQSGLFNPELLEKLNVYRIEMPALSNRLDEFEDIVTGIIHEITWELHKQYLRDLSPSAWSRLRSYEWPGNIRELRNVLRLAITAAKGDRIECEDLPDFGPTREDFRTTREQFEKIYLLELLKSLDWELDQASSVTHIDKQTLISKIKDYGFTLNQK